MNDLTILVNTSDGFEDCWPAFFQLFRTYWPDCPYPIVLNTEKKFFTWPGVDIRSACVSKDSDRRLTWSECLVRCLDSIDTPYVLYLQEDFFLEAPVNATMIDRFLDVMRAGQADVIRIMECGGSGPWKPSEHQDLWVVDQQARYRIALQAALWKTSVLRSYLKMHESPWQLEVFGSRRARRRRNERVLCVNRDLYHGQSKEIFPYFPTGVVSGMWDRRAVVDLFARQGIAMDFSKRGFIDERIKLPKKPPLIKRLVDRVRSFF